MCICAWLYVRAYMYLYNLFQSIIKQVYITLMHPEHLHFVQSM